MRSSNDEAPIELEEDLGFQRWDWRTSRVVWTALVITMVATVAGVFGGGPASSTTAGDTDSPFWVQYSRFGRFGSSMRIEVHVRPEPDGTVRVGLDESLIRAFRVTAVTPNPQSTLLAPDGVQYEFNAPGPYPAVILFEVQPAQRWAIESHVRSAHGALRLWQFIYP